MDSRKIRELRDKTGLSQSQFAKRFKIPVSTLRKWEQMESTPPSYFVLLLEKQIESLFECDKVLKDEKNEFYIDYNKGTIMDKFGNALSYEGNIENIDDNFLIFGIESFFDKYYSLIKGLNKFINDASEEALRNNKNGNK